MKKWTLYIILLLCIVQNVQAEQYVLDGQAGDYAGGLNTRDNSLILNKNEAHYIRNLYTDENKGLKSALGFTEISSFPVAGKTSQWGYALEKTNGERYMIVAVEDALYFTTDKKIWTLIKSGLHWLENNFQAATINNKAIITNGQDTVFYFDGQLHGGYYYVDLDFIPKGEYIAVNNNMVYIGPTEDNQSAIYVCDALDDFMNADAWPADQYKEIGKQDGDYITGLRAVGKFVMATKRFSSWGIYGLFFDELAVEPISRQYGSLQQEGIFENRNRIYFPSHEGYKFYDGASVQPADYEINPDMLNCNNFKGEWAFWQQSTTDDFDAGSSTNVMTDLNELKLKQYEFTWNSENFSLGTDSHTTSDKGYVALSTSEIAAVTQAVLPAFTYDITAETEYANGCWSFVDGVWMEEGGQGNSGDGRSSTAYWGRVHNNAYNMFDTASGYGNTVCSRKNPPGAGGDGIVRVQKNNTVLYTANPITIIPIGIVDGGTGINLDRIEISADFLLGNFSLYWHYLTASITQQTVSYNLKHFGVQQNLLIEITYVDNKTASFSIPIQKKTINDVNATSGRSTQSKIESQWWNPKPDGYSPGPDMDTVDFINGRVITWRHPNVYKTNVKNIELKLSHVAIDEDGIRSKPIEVSMPYKGYIANIYDISIYKRGTIQVFNASGYNISVSTNIEGVAHNVNFSSLTASCFNDYTAYGTTVTFQTATSTNGVNWTAYSAVTGDPATGAKINSAAGRYIKVKQLLTGTTSYSPFVDEVKVTAQEPSGNLDTPIYNVGKAAGGWGYFSANYEANGETVGFKIRFGTGTTDIGNTAFSTIVNGGLATGTTNETYVQIRVNEAAASGINAPVVKSFMIKYAPDQTPATLATIAMEDRGLIAVSTASSGAWSLKNSSVYVNQKNDTWTMFDYMHPAWFLRFGKDYYFGDNTLSKIYKMNIPNYYKANGEHITYEYRKKLDFGYPDYDKHLMEVHATLKDQATGRFNYNYKIENATTTYEIPVDYTNTGILSWRTRIPAHSGVKNFESIYKSTSPFEGYKTGYYYTIENLR